MKNRSTNFELLRIILTLFIPIYHWLLYNGLFYADNSTNTLYSTLLFSGIPFSCLYAFLAMSSFFLIKKGNNWSFKKLFIFLGQILTLLVFKNIVIYTLSPHYYFTDYYQFFFVNGAWWYVWAYLTIMIFYPLLNYFIYNVPAIVLYASTFILGIIFVINNYINHTVFLNDCFTFLFIYLFMGCLERHNTCSDFYKKHKKIILIFMYIISVSALNILSFYLKHPSNSLDLELENAILQNFHSRYNIFGFISGIALFTFFKDIKIEYKPLIHRISGITFFVFLLHETVMCAFWYFDIKSKEYLAYLPEFQFFAWILLYIICCVLVAYVINNIYSSLFTPLWNKIIDSVCKLSFIKKFEHLYQSLFISFNK